MNNTSECMKGVIDLSENQETLKNRLIRFFDYVCLYLETTDEAVKQSLLDKITALIPEVLTKL